MTLFNSIRFLHLASYLLITSQLLFYIYILSDALRIVPINNYLELRKTIDSGFGSRFSLMYYSCLALSLVVVLMSPGKPTSVVFITSLIALICVIADVLIAMKGNVPLNQLTNDYTQHNGTDWNTIRSQWLKLIGYRAVITVSGMLALFAGLLLNQKS
jgi:hypothetical protein